MGGFSLLGTRWRKKRGVKVRLSPCRCSRRCGGAGGGSCQQPQEPVAFSLCTVPAGRLGSCWSCSCRSCGVERSLSGGPCRHLPWSLPHTEPFPGHCPSAGCGRGCLGADRARMCRTAGTHLQGCILLPRASPGTAIERVSKCR